MFKKKYMSKQIKIHTLQGKEAFWEQKRNEFLVAAYEKNESALEHIFADILEHLKSDSQLSENSEKHLHQIQLIFKRFYPLSAHVQFPKLRDQNKRLKKLILASIKQSSNNIRYIDFPNWENNLGLNKCQKDILYKTLMTFQLTSGCSNFCRRCNEWALPKVRSHFSFKAVLELLNKMAEQENNEISLFGASDPLDWNQDEKNISHVLRFLEKSPIEYSILTKVPKNREELLKRLIRNQANLSVSITSRNKSRILKIEQELQMPVSKQHNLDELLIPAGLDEDFTSVKPSITDGYGTEITPDGAFIIIPSFTSALHPFGHKKIPVTENTIFFPVKKTGRHALLVDYFKPIEGYNLNKELYYLRYLLDVQIESILLDNGREELTPPGMRSIKEFFSIFEEKARLQRKKMTPAVLKRLKNKYDESTDLYLQRKKSHFDSCKKEKCLESKVLAVSFFLDSIYRYQIKNPNKVKIILFLLKEEIKNTLHTYKPMTDKRPCQEILSDPDMDSFDVFRFYVFTLLTHSDKEGLLAFIKTYPSSYDPIADIFVQTR